MKHIMLYQAYGSYERRIGMTERTPEAEEELKRQFVLSPMLEDVCGNIHYKVPATRKEK